MQSITPYLYMLVTLISAMGMPHVNAAEAQEDIPGSSRLLFSLAGSNTVGENLAPAWAEAFLAAKSATRIYTEPMPVANEYRVHGTFEREQVHIDIRAHGSSTGFAGLKDRSADIAMSSRGIKPNEITALAGLGDLSTAAGEHVVAIDGLAVIVHPQNPIAALSMENIALIFSGKITNWRELGGLNDPISLHARDDNSGTWDTFKSLVLGESHRLAMDAARYESNDELSASVTKDIGAIGFVGLASVNESKALAIYDGETDALTPQPLHVATEDYLLARRLFLYTSTTPTALVQEFVHFCQTQNGQEVVEKIGFVAQNPLRQVVENTAGPAFYREIARHGERLTTNFRFQPNSAELDNKAKRDVQRLAQYLKQPQNQGLRVQLIGFSDDRNRESLAEVLSRLRATVVKIELFRHGITTEAVVGFGASRPLAQTLDTTSKNNRVEVWVYADDRDETLKTLRRRAVNPNWYLDTKGRLNK